MSGQKHNYLGNSYSPDELFDDVDDDKFVNSFRNRIPPTQPRPTVAQRNHHDSYDQQRQAMLQRQREIEQRTLDSSARSIGLLRESEDIGIATAVELTRQREALQNTNKRLDDINTNLNYSQKHINGIKSVFYGLKNYISGKSDQTPKSQVSPSSHSGGPSNSRLNHTLDELSQNTSSSADHFSSHPATRLRQLEMEAPGPATDSQRVNDILDANLEEMAQVIGRLKGLGMALGDEIEQQSELIDTIQDKVEVADIKIGKQNKDMNKLLGK